MRTKGLPTPVKRTYSDSSTTSYVNQTGYHHPKSLNSPVSGHPSLVTGLNRHHLFRTVACSYETLLMLRFAPNN